MATGMSKSTPESAARPPRLLDRVCEALRMRHYSPRTEEAYCGWIRRFVLFHGRRHPRELGSPEIEAFLSHLAVAGRVSASTQNQALAALLFLYVHVLGHPPEALGDFVRAKRPERVPVVLTPTEVSAVLERLSGTPKLMASLLYGAGLRLLECARLRVKDVDLERRELIVREGKGAKDRTTMLPTRLIEPLRAHLVGVRRQFEEDLRDGAGWVELPDALARKYPNAGREWPWQWVFPATRTYAHGETGQGSRFADRVRRRSCGWRRKA
jgi:integron integrase